MSLMLSVVLFKQLRFFRRLGIFLIFIIVPGFLVILGLTWSSGVFFTVFVNRISFFFFRMSLLLLVLRLLLMVLSLLLLVLILLLLSLLLLRGLLLLWLFGNLSLLVLFLLGFVLFVKTLYDGFYLILSRLNITLFDIRLFRLNFHLLRIGGRINSFPTGTTSTL